MEVILFIILAVLDQVRGHAIFWEPPSRASLGKHNMNFCYVPVNDDHMSLYCGGIMVQHKKYGGKCGICGDAYGEEQQPHRYPGPYATGIIGRSYFEPGQVIDVFIDVVANHKGFFAFKICPNDNPELDPDQDCFDRYPLEYVNGEKYFFLKPAMRNGGTRIELRLKLPDGLECWQCIIQWTYVSGNNWGIGPQMADYATPDCLRSKQGKLGCGPQETFRGCADVCIGPKCPRDVCAYARPFENEEDNVTTEQPPTSSSTTPAGTGTTSTASTTSTSSTTTASTVTSDGGHDHHGGHVPPIYQQTCLWAGIKKNFFSEAGDRYCKDICVGHPMDLCNLFLCYCKTQFVNSRDADSEDGEAFFSEAEAAEAEDVGKNNAAAF